MECNGKVKLVAFFVIGMVLGFSIPFVPANEVVYCEVYYQMTVESVVQTTYIQIGERFGSGIAWRFYEEVPCVVRLDSGDRNLFRVQWYLYTDNGTHSETIMKQSEAFDISFGFLEAANGSLLFRLFDDSIRLIFTTKSINVLGWLMM